MKGLEFIFLGVGSVLGAYLRFKVIESPLLFNTIPVNVLAVNVLGAFILGAFIVMSQQFCGSLTTMSGLALESNTLLEQSHYGTFAINLIANIGLSIAALIGGKSLMSAIINN
jgi:CrcB protein